MRNVKEIFTLRTARNDVTLYGCDNKVFSIPGQEKLSFAAGKLLNLTENI